MDIAIAPSILSADFGRLEDDIRAAERGSPDYFHCDIMDGHFVPNISFGPMVVRKMRELTDVPLDVHLMITDPDRYIPAFVEAGASLIYPHIEAPHDVYRTVQLVNDLGVRAGITLNPGTPVEWVVPLLDQVESVLLMSVCPGFGGQEFIPGTIARVRRLRALLDEHRPEVGIAVDGGVSEANATDLVRAGADFLIAGSAVFRAPDIAEAVRRLRAAAERGKENK